MSDRVHDAQARLLAAVDGLRAASIGADDDALLAILQVCETVTRRLDHVAVEALAAVQRRGVFAGRGYRSAPAAVSDLLRCERRQARRQVVVAEQAVLRTGPDGTALPARLPATATVFASGEAGIRHAEAIADVLGSRSAERLDPETWSAAEVALAEQATRCTPSELRIWGFRLVETLDQDGPVPDDRPEPGVNELRIVRHRRRPGGTIRARFDDAARFDAIAAALDAHAAPRDAGDGRIPAERRADALAEICGYALEHAPSSVLPRTGGRRPALTVTIDLRDLEGRARSSSLEFGGRIGPASLRMLACDAAVLPAVLGGAGLPLDVGRARRTVPDGLRRAVVVRDGGCAHPGCDRGPSWCEVHHVVPWEHGGSTALSNLVLLCRVHHRVVHHAGWEVRFRHGRPEFVPPAWVDPRRRPRAGPVPAPGYRPQGKGPPPWPSPMISTAPPTRRGTGSPSTPVPT